MKDNLINFLYDKKYFINVYEGFVHVFNYKELVHLNKEFVQLKMDGFILDIKGNDLFVTQMMGCEILIKGVIERVEFTYE